MGPLLFAIGIHDLIQDLALNFPELDLNAWYLDDGNLVGDSDRVIEAFTFINLHAGDYGLSLNIPKCEIWRPKKDPAWNRLLGNSTMFVNTSEGTEILGGCVGSNQAKEAFLSKKVNKISDTLDLVEDLDDPQVQLHLIRACFGLPKISYALRTLPYEHVVTGIHKFDRVLDHSLEAIFGSPLSPTQRDQVALPIGNGFPGFGIGKQL